MHANSDKDILSRIPRAATIELERLLGHTGGESVLYNAVRGLKDKASNQVENITDISNFDTRRRDLQPEITPFANMVSVLNAA